jgi:hypothetical protein
VDGGRDLAIHASLDHHQQKRSAPCGVHAGRRAVGCGDFVEIASHALRFLGLRWNRAVLGDQTRQMRSVLGGFQLLFQVVCCNFSARKFFAAWSSVAV